ncbi:MAG TPA: PEP-CTERM sorting domain-containing protein [Terriglobales bacterium]|nr:PEP-CTERM sorting domain-containing protein [Terriglobales bacterium]
MKPSNKILRILICGIILAMCSVAAYADSNNDPRVIIKGAGLIGNETVGVHEHFTFGLPGDKDTPFDGDLSFRNVTSQTWTTLALFESAFGPLQIQCNGGGFFNHCMKFADPKNPSLTEILFTNTVGYGKLGTGILPGENFTLGFRPVDGTHWMGDTDFTAVATTAVPEPSTIAFLVTGIGAMFSRRKLWNRA